MRGYHKNRYSRDSPQSIDRLDVASHCALPRRGAPLLAPFHSHVQSASVDYTREEIGSACGAEVGLTLSPARVRPLFSISSLFSFLRVHECDFGWHTEGLKALVITGLPSSSHVYTLVARTPRNSAGLRVSMPTPPIACQLAAIGYFGLAVPDCWNCFVHATMHFPLL